MPAEITMVLAAAADAAALLEVAAKTAGETFRSLGVDVAGPLAELLAEARHALIINPSPSARAAAERNRDELMALVAQLARAADAMEDVVKFAPAIAAAAARASVVVQRTN